jgi:tetratricopeptide (TPR) repeat protein
LRAAAVLAAVALCASLPARGLADEEPACALRCRELARRGELRAGVSDQGCMLRLCHDEARRLYVEAKYDEALAALERVRPGLAASAAYQMDLGLVEYARGNFEAALAAFEHVIEREPDSLRAGSQRAHVLVRLERFADARAQFEKLLELPAARTELQGLKTTSYLQGNLGAISLIEDDVGGARTALAKALELDAANTLAATYLYRVLPEVEAKRMDGRGVWLMMLASEDAALYQLARASRQLEELIARAPRFAEAYFLQADILRSQRSYLACEETLRRAEQQLPDDAGLRAERLRCELLRRGGQAPEARPLIAELQRLGQTHPDNERIRQVLLDLAGE